VEQPPQGLRIGVGELPRQLEIDRERDEVLRGAVVEIALDPAALGVRGGDDPRPRRPQLLDREAQLLQCAVHRGSCRRSRTGRQAGQPPTDHRASTPRNRLATRWAAAPARRSVVAVEIAPGDLETEGTTMNRSRTITRQAAALLLAGAVIAPAASARSDLRSPDARDAAAGRYISGASDRAGHGYRYLGST